jgi:hypothetical protein
MLSPFRPSQLTRMANNRGRTDLGEMAQTAAVEAINAVVGPRSESLFGSGPDEVQRAFAALATPAQFGALARQFFSRFAFKSLGYFLSKAAPLAIGEGKRFRTVAEQAQFTDVPAHPLPRGQRVRGPVRRRVVLLAQVPNRRRHHPRGDAGGSTPTR